MTRLPRPAIQPASVCALRPQGSTSTQVSAHWRAARSLANWRSARGWRRPAAYWAKSPKNRNS